MTISDDERWIAAARTRYARSASWERDAEAVFQALKAQCEARTTTEPPLPGCPACAERPPMLEFPRYELLTESPLLYCGQCYGFWAAGDSLARGVADPGSIHAALESLQAPRRCRACFGRLTDNDSCRECGWAAPALNCPQCSGEMARVCEAGIRLDHCAACDGTWFDTGEIAAVYKLVPGEGLAMSTVEETAPHEEGPAWLLAASILARVFLPFV